MKSQNTTDCTSLYPTSATLVASAPMSRVAIIESRNVDAWSDNTRSGSMVASKTTTTSTATCMHEKTHPVLVRDVVAVVLAVVVRVTEGTGCGVGAADMKGVLEQHVVPQLANTLATSHKLAAFRVKQSATGNKSGIAGACV